MNPERWEKIESLCQRAMGLENEKQADFLEKSCAGDQKLLNDIKSLLNQQDEKWLHKPLVQVQSSFVFSDGSSISEHTIGPYRLIRTIASGGMGRVYLAVRNDEQFERFVALKVVQQNRVSDEILKRFYEERQILASLNHPFIARMFDGGTTEENMPWFAMEYVEGMPVTDYCNHHQKSIDERIDLFLKVCSAVQYAHQNLVVHQDLKPANILITPDGTPKLLDFGIAGMMNLGQKTVHYQSRMLTPEYASPEQIQNRPVTTASDVYSLGVLLCQLLSGSLPYTFEENDPELIEQTICNEIPSKPSHLSGSKKLRGELDEIILKAIRKKPSERYASVEQLAGDIRRYQKNIPTLAHDHTIPYRARKFIIRNRWSVSVTAAIMLLVAAFAIVTYFQSKTIEARAHEVEQQRDRAEQVSTFLTELFESADPSEAGDRTLSAVELVHRGAERVETELSDQPRLQSNLYIVLAEVYESLGLFDEGIGLAQEAYNIQQRIYGDSHADIAKSLNILGWLHRQKGEFEAADSLLQASLQMRRQIYDDQHLDIARSLNDLAVLKQSRGDYAATDTLLRETIDMRRSLQGENHESVAVALSNYAALKWRLGDMEAAETNMREALTIFQESVNEDDMRVAVTMTNLAAILLHQNDINGAEELYRNALDIRLRLVGKEHPDVAYSYAHLGNLLRLKGENEEAKIFLTKALELRVKLLGDDHILVGDSKRVLGQFYQGVGKFDKAEKTYLGAIDSFQQTFPDGHARTAQVMHMLGELYLEMKNFREASSQLQKAVSLYTQIFGEDDQRTLDSQIDLGICLVRLKESERAHALLTDALEILNHSRKPHDELVTKVHEALADIH